MPLQSVHGRVCIILVLTLCVLNITRATSCRRRCGNVEVPFPFGLDDDDPSCYYPDPNSFSLKCSASFPPKLLLGNYEVMDIRISNAKMRILKELDNYCYYYSRRRYRGPSSFAMANGTQTFSYTDNIYVGIGCDAVVILAYNTNDGNAARFSSFNYSAGCIASCTSMDEISDGQCSGSGCCQISIRKNLQAYTPFIGSHYDHRVVSDFSPCSYSFLVEKGNYTFHASDLMNMSKSQEFPVVLDWFVGNESCEVASKIRTSYACVSNYSYCSNSTNGPGYICQCSAGFQGNPYVSDGCQDINECAVPKSCHSAAVCINTVGNYSCMCPAGTTGDPYISGCARSPRKQSAVLGISVGISCGLVMLSGFFGSTYMRKMIKKRRAQHQRRLYFKTNNDILLRQLVLSGENETAISRIKAFSLKDLEKATSKFDSSTIVGDGGHGQVYKGILNFHAVAIKKCKVEIEIEKEQFINEVILLSQIHHKNVVKLIGCCLECVVPLLVYEFVSNGTLSSHLHAETRANSLSWVDRLRIATEISSALAFMHTKANISIYHRDIKSSNILLDDALTAKVSDFGASKTLRTDQTYINTAIQGTYGYMDPEYMHTGRLTEKTDVYSLGVILVELMTGLNPCSNKKHHDEGNLISHFFQAVENKKLSLIIDRSILDEANMVELESVTKLAIACTHLRSADRPTIKEVERTLEGLMDGTKKVAKKKRK